MRDLVNNIHLKCAIAAVTQTNSDTAITGEIVDLQGCDSATLILQMGTITDADATFAVTFEHGDAADLAGATNPGDTAANQALYFIGTFTALNFNYGDDKECRKIGYRGGKRYIRATVTPTNNNSGAVPLSGTWVLGHLSQAPSPNPPS